MTSLSETSMIAGSSGVTSGYTIDQSIRFNDNDSPSLDKTYSGAGSRTTFTFSCWFKLGGYFSGTGSMPFFNGGTGASDTGWTGVSVRYDGSGADIAVQGYNTNWKVTTRKFRDHSAWYHLVWVWDTSNSVASDRTRIYINGERETDFSTSNNPGASANAGIGQAQKHSIGYQSRTVGHSYADMYMAEIHFLDSYAYGPEYFGEFKEDTDIWIPKEYTGSYGTNGFKIDGRDSSDLGDDESGQGNDFATSGLAANDQRTDSPTNNHCVMNPIVGGSATFANGNLDLSYSASSWTTARGTVAIPNNSGIYYYEAKVISHAIYLSFGWGDVDMGANQNNNPATPKYYVYSDYNGKYYSSTDDGSIGDGFTNNDVIGLWYDSGSTSNNLKFYRNGTLQSSGTKSFDFSDVTHVAPVTQFYSSNSVEYRFDSAYWTNAPAGITSLNAITTNNLGAD